ncbi:hypothetical protein MCOR17_004880 [Pyricularia oryzae]|nr:hypothetical protein MCOR17_004880 [Pyricularia oryzae]
MLSAVHTWDSRSTFVTSDIDNDTKASLQEFESMGWKWWLVHPRVLELITPTTTPDAKSSLIFQNTGIFTVRRGMDSGLTLPNRTVTYPREKIPPHSIITEELQFGHRFGDVMENTEAILKNISTPFVGEDTDNIGPAPSGDDSDGNGADSGREASASLDMGLIRLLQFLAIDYLSWSMIHAEDDTRDADSAELGKLLALKGVNFEAKHRQVRQSIKKSLSGGEARLGSVTVDALIQYSGDGPLSWVYSKTCTDPRTLPPSGRAEMIHFMLSESPLIARVVEICMEEKKRGQRVLVMTPNPWIQALIAAILEKASFGVTTIRAGLSQAERDKAVTDFTDSSSSLDVCVLSINISSAGLNLHHNCCTGIIIPLMWNANTQLQICGRLIRLGQSKPVTWRILEVRGTLFDWVKDRMFRKMSLEYITRMRLPEIIVSPVVKQLLAYEAMAVMFSWPFNCFAWIAEPPQKINDFCSDRTRRMGEFYSRLASMLVSDIPAPFDEGDVVDKTSAFVLLLGPAYVDYQYQEQNGGRDTIADHINRTHLPPFDLDTMD